MVYDNKTLFSFSVTFGLNKQHCFASCKPSLIIAGKDGVES